jgi:hypothetical protein
VCGGGGGAVVVGGGAVATAADSVPFREDIDSFLRRTRVNPAPVAAVTTPCKKNKIKTRIGWLDSENDGKGTLVG